MHRGKPLSGFCCQFCGIGLDPNSDFDFCDSVCEELEASYSVAIPADEPPAPLPANVIIGPWVRK